METAEAPTVEAGIVPTSQPRAAEGWTPRQEIGDLQHHDMRELEPPTQEDAKPFYDGETVLENSADQDVVSKDMDGKKSEK